ncbi:hypothetical protein [Sphingobium yanoikuyae]|uniref:Uncharacterized protein n=1 Tax=Sphingobium yanoikuyae TaxID=13690 RepID=A0A291N083_SPHYA|nr:hypothetical protein [Sphingobium yanoikuyae]ATI80568.1 hypothetical protein A6768_11580 [Sphingobium yanoikuyae]
MNTTTGIFGQATGFTGMSVDMAGASDHLLAIRRHLQGVFLTGGQPRGQTTSTLRISTQLTAMSYGLGQGRAAASLLPATTDLLVMPVRTRTAAEELLDAIKLRSGLILEEIATLMRTSRRTLQNWRTGAPINSVNERRLRDLAVAIEALHVGDAAKTRKRLLDKREGTVRLFDLLAEGRFDTAVAIASGNVAQTPSDLGGEIRTDIASRLTAAAEIKPLRAGVPSERRLRSRARD